MRLADFEAMVRRMADEIPAEFLDGIAEIVVSPRTVPHPDRTEVFTLGECIPLPAPHDDPETLQSRIVLYHGSFAAVTRDHPDLDWREEAWETLTHELRHHVEWKARVPDLEALDQAAEHNYRRHDGLGFDPLFFRDGERVGAGAFRVEDDYFIECVFEEAAPPATVTFSWGGCRYRAQLPPGLALPAYAAVDGVRDPPDGEVVLVLLRRPRWWDLIGKTEVRQVSVVADDAGAGGDEEAR